MAEVANFKTHEQTGEPVESPKAKGVGCVPYILGAPVGSFATLASQLVWGVGFKEDVLIGFGIAGAFVGITGGLFHAEQAERFAEDGNPRREFLESLKSKLTSVIWLAAAGGAGGYKFAGPEGAVFGSILGGAFGGGLLRRFSSGSTNTNGNVG